ncbi:phosphoenolpyruvate synthase [Pedobacter vanadiisoli]|uniref:Phosphoenolpyruvate synthase n=1 Tax=Pedobacter vanadiisoli TaxID=1761975 RepID=A0ABW5MJH1_9SPHI
MGNYVIGFEEIDKSDILKVGGKGANLGALSKIEGIVVPGGFCISTEAYRKLVENHPEIKVLLDQLTNLKAENRVAITGIGSKIRSALENLPIPLEITREIEIYLDHYNENEPFAVRSSATAEDLPTASFAGQQDTYLNILGKEAILRHISKCWASLFTDRAITYRIQNGFDHHKVQLSVVVQKMIFAEAAGVMFTANPITGNRKVLSIDAGFGLGEAMVSGLVNADNYQVCDGKIADKKIPAKKLAIWSLKGGGTKVQELPSELQARQVLSDEQILQLEALGRKIETHFGSPQDIEWCWINDTFYILQSRPITTLFPVPEAGDNEKHVYISVGHQQMMTDPMKPLGLSLWQLRAARPMYKAGGRLFVDVIDSLATATGRKNLLEAMEQHDPLIKDALVTIIEREDFIKSLPDDGAGVLIAKSTKGLSSAEILKQAGSTPAIVFELIKQSEESIEILKRNIQTKSGPELFDFILEDIELSKKMAFDSEHIKVIIAAMNAASWINEKMDKWLGEKNVSDILSQSVSNNITSEMGLALLDVADAIRPFPEIINYLQEVKDDRFLEELPRFNGGTMVKEAIEDYLNKYGMRCAGEIDITNTRWGEKPSILIPLILSNIKNFEPYAGKQKFDRGRAEALKKEKELLNKLALLPEAEQKIGETKEIISLLRNFAGYREYPKYAIVSRFYVYKQALIKEAEKLLEAGVIDEKETVYYLTFNELKQLVVTHKSDKKLIAQRKEEHRLYEKLNPPRVITSDGEIISGRYHHQNLPEGAIVGLAVSSGVIEGRARVILNIESADLEDGDILVTTFTDPSWTPLFVSVKGLITEVGGLMTHGAVIAREYGLPAVVGVENATKLIKDGQRIRVNGTDGYVEILKS